MYPVQINQIDTFNEEAFITPERLDAFSITNAHAPTKMVAVYAQHMNQAKFVDFNGIAAGVSTDVYLLMVAFCCLLIMLFAFIEHVRPSNINDLWDFVSTVVPCLSCQARHTLN